MTNSPELALSIELIQQASVTLMVKIAKISSPSIYQDGF